MRRSGLRVLRHQGMLITKRPSRRSENVSELEDLRKRVAEQERTIEFMRRRMRVLDVVQAALEVEHYHGHPSLLANTAETYASECRKAVPQ